jgi:hypothetical protein
MSHWIGKFPSLKLGRMVGYQSLIERDFIYLLDFAPAISDYCEQPFSIHYKEGDKERQYTPDFSFVHCGKSYLIECKHHQYIQPDKNKLKWEAAHRWCQAHGTAFHVITEQKIRSRYYLENVMLLTDYARYVVDSATKTAVLQILAQSPTSMTVNDLMRKLSPDQPQTALTAILHLAYHHFLQIPLVDAPITVASPVTFHSAVNVNDSSFLPKVLSA